MTAPAAIVFTGTDWLWPIVILFAISVALLASGLRRAPAAPSVRAVCALLKLAGFAALALCLLQPVWTRSHAKPGANFFAVLADNSQGMQIKERDAKKSRGDQMKELLGTGKWQESLADTFSLRRYSFDARLQPVADFSELDFTGPATSLAGAVRDIAERYRGQPLAGILLFSDGNATDFAGGGSPSSAVPIYPVVIGRDEAPRDVSLQRVAARQTAFEDAPVTIQAEVAAPGYQGSQVAVQLLDASGKKIDEQVQTVERDDKTLNFRFTTKPPYHGVAFYSVRAAARHEMAALTNAAPSTEATLANNVRAVAINRGHGPHRILYVSGRPNWEFKFLNRALAPDDELQMVALIRIARREPKFEFMGRRGESSNPLFRGFDRQEEDTERYDQPVFVRLNTRDELELKGGFPKVAEDLYGYDAVILDDVEAEFFGRDQMTLVQKYVSERGGAMLMLGGAESFHEGNYNRTPIGDMLPVYIDRPAAAAPPPAPNGTRSSSPGVKLTLTREGWLEPWLRLRDNESQERARLNDMPGFLISNVARDVKPGASVLAVIEDPAQPGRADAAARTPRPALVAQRFGNGRTAALLIGDLWHWGLHDEAMHRDMDKAWRQMMRWLVTDVPAQVEVNTASASTGGPGLTIEVKARDRKFQPIDNSTVQVLVTPVGPNGKSTNTIRLACEPAPAAPGVYTTTYIPRISGGYHAEAVVLDQNGAQVGRGETGWTSDPAADEFRSLKPNRALLETLAKQSGGELVNPDGLDRFVQSLPNRKAPVTETISQPLWHTPAMFSFAILCFVAEWGVRRLKGLA